MLTSSTLEHFAKGGMVILCDDKNRENEGDLCQAGQFVTAESVNFCTKNGRGLICTSISSLLAHSLNLPLMVKEDENNSGFKTPFTISVEAAKGVSTGISTFDRAHTISLLANPQSTTKDFVKPGHIFPLIARENGVFERRGQTEGSNDLCKITKLFPVAMICEILNDDGTMARMPELKIVSQKFNLPIISVEEIYNYRKENEKNV